MNQEFLYINVHRKALCPMNYTTEPVEHSDGDNYTGSFSSFRWMNKLAVIIMQNLRSPFSFWAGLKPIIWLGSIVKRDGRKRTNETRRKGGERKREMIGKEEKDNYLFRNQSIKQFCYVERRPDGPTDWLSDRLTDWLRFGGVSEWNVEKKMVTAKVRQKMPARQTDIFLWDTLNKRERERGGETFRGTTKKQSARD